MSLQNLQQLSAEDQRKVKEFLTTGKSMLQEMADYRESLKDKTKDLAEHLGIDASDLTSYLKTSFKDEFGKVKEKFEIQESLAQIAGDI